MRDKREENEEGGQGKDTKDEHMKRSTEIQL